MSNHLLPRVSTNISLVCLQHSALYIILCSGKFQPRLFTNLKYLDKSRMSLADCGPVCLCCDARLRSHTIVFHWLTICFSCSPFVMAASHKNPSDIVTQPRPVTLLRLISVTHTHKHLANCHTTKSKTPDIFYCMLNDLIRRSEQERWKLRALDKFQPNERPNEEGPDRAKKDPSSNWLNLTSVVS